MPRLHLLPLLVGLLAIPFAACSSGGSASPASDDAGDEGGTLAVARDGGRRDVGAPAVDAKTPYNRMQPHQRHVLTSMRLEVVYLGFAGDDGSTSFDAFLDWLLASDYWGLMKQYGVGAAARLGSVRLPRTAMIPAGSVKNGLITAEDLEMLIYASLHGGADAGLDGDAAGVPDADASPATPLIPIADAYLIFLPNGVNVDLGQRGGRTFQTCVDAGGYHSYDGAEPYAVIPPCAFGRSALAVSHELTEMATDPVPGTGWYSDKDVDNAGGEIADLCNQPAPHGVEGWDVTQLWSNADGDCEPY